MKPNKNNFHVKFFIDRFSVFYLKYHMFCLTPNSNGLTPETRQMAINEALPLIDIIVDNWPNTEFYRKINEIHEEVITKHHKDNDSGRNNSIAYYNNTIADTIYI